MAFELAVAAAAGLVAHSIALIVFGIDSGIELLTASVVLRRLFLRSSTIGDDRLDEGERTASRIVGYVLFALITYIVISSAYSFLVGAKVEASVPGVAIAAAALVVMPALWRWRLSLAKRLGSPALGTDAACSLVCLYMSAVLLAGLVLNALFGLWRADSLAALAMVWWIRGEGLEALEAAKTGERCECGG
jgi:divalent metal cation (Fe/Co/Zn/Cd) transporter